MGKYIKACVHLQSDHLSVKMEWQSLLASMLCLTQTPLEYHGKNAVVDNNIC